VNIRRAKHSDRPRIAAVQAESWRDAYADVLPDAYLTDQIATDLERHWSELKIQTEDVVLVAEDNGIFGFIAVWCRPDPFIDNLHVIPSQRSKGLGSALLRSAAQRLLEKGYTTAYLWVVASNERALQLYKRLAGIRTDMALKPLFGHRAPHIKVEWPDISVLC
jgi:ribosomal protein S18 acetylase RimI-like enzyme